MARMGECFNDMKQFARLDYNRLGQSKMIKRNEEIINSREIGVKALKEQQYY